MLRSRIARLAVFVVAAGLWAMSGSAKAANEPPLPKMYYYPYQYVPHSYWPANTPQWPAAYMAYPPFKEPGWRYELWTPMKYYRGNHFWLDQF
jgi:hypothetical protein